MCLLYNQGVCSSHIPTPPPPPPPSPPPPHLRMCLIRLVGWPKLVIFFFFCHTGGAAAAFSQAPDSLLFLSYRGCCSCILTSPQLSSSSAIQGVLQLHSHKLVIFFFFCHTGGAAAAFSQAPNSAQRPEVSQHAGGPPLEGQGD